MNKWIYINILILIYAITLVSYNFHVYAQVLGLLGLFIILYNWSRHAIFSMIRSNIPRTQKIKYAQLSKKVLPYHKWTGSLAWLIIFIHGVFVIQNYGWWIQSPKFLLGLIAFLILSLQVFSGWLRWYRTTVKRRYLHWINAFVLIFVIVLHMLF